MTYTRKLISFDWALKKLLRNKANFGILEGFLSELLGQDLKILQVLESESNKNHRDDKYNRVDVLVRLQSDELVLIEVQVDSEFDYFYRMLYGISKVITDYMQRGDAYNKIKKIYSVNILYFDLGHGKDYIYHGTTKFVGLHEQDELTLSKKQQEIYQKAKIHQIYPEYYLLKVNQFDDHAKNTLDEWIYFLKNEEVKDNFHAKGLAEAKDKLDELKLPDDERRAYSRYLDDLHYQASMVETAKYEEMFALRDAEQHGMEKGMQEGMEKGKELGKVEGQLEEKRATAKRMKDAGMSPELIQQVTGMDADEIGS